MINKMWNLGATLMTAALLLGCSKSDSVSASTPLWDDVYSQSEIIVPITSVVLYFDDSEEKDTYINIDAIKNMYRDLFFNNSGFTTPSAIQRPISQKVPWNYESTHLMYKNGASIDLYIARGGAGQGSADGREASEVKYVDVYQNRFCRVRALLYRDQLKKLEVWINPGEILDLTDEDMNQCMVKSFSYAYHIISPQDQTYFFGASARTPSDPRYCKIYLRNPDARYPTNNSLVKDYGCLASQPRFGRVLGMLLQSREKINCAVSEHKFSPLCGDFMESVLHASGAAFGSWERGLDEDWKRRISAAPLFLQYPWTGTKMPTQTVTISQ